MQFSVQILPQLQTSMTPYLVCKTRCTVNQSCPFVQVESASIVVEDEFSICNETFSSVGVCGQETATKGRNNSTKSKNSHKLSILIPLKIIPSDIEIPRNNFKIPTLKVICTRVRRVFANFIAFSKFCPVVTG